MSFQVLLEERRTAHHWAERLRDGRFFVVRPAEKPGDRSGGTRLIVAESKRFGYATQVMPPPGVREAVIRFVAPASLRVTLAGYDESSDHRLARVVVAPESSEGLPGIVSWQQEAGPDGEAVFRALRPGRYRLAFRLQSTLHEDTVVLVPGENAVTIPIPSVHTVTVMVSPGNGVHTFQVTKHRRESSEPTIRQSARVREGVATIGGLPAGTYTLLALGAASQQSMTIQVPADAPIVFQPANPTALLVDWMDGAAYPASKGLQRNDLIVGVDGNGFDGSSNASTVLRGTLMSRKECRLIVERAGRRFEVTVDSARFSEATRNANLLQPLTR